MSQYVASKDGFAPLYRELRKLFVANHPPTRVHEFFAAFPGRMKAMGEERYPLIVTTNYDDALERAFDARGEPYDVVWYIADPRSGAASSGIGRRRSRHEDHAPQRLQRARTSTSEP